MSKLKSLNQPIAMIKARHSLGAQTLSADDMGGLEPVIYLSKGAKVMLTMNLWTDVGLCNGAIGTVLDFVYAEGRVSNLHVFLYVYWFSLMRNIKDLQFLLRFNVVFQFVPLPKFLEAWDKDMKDSNRD